mgnify:CR=1 FL=1
MVMVIASATEPLFASLMKPLINEGFVNRNPHELLWTSMSIVGLFVVRALASFGNDYSTTWLASRLVVRLREAMFAKLLRLPVSYYDNNASGRLISRLSNDVNQVSDAGFNVITVSVRDGVTIAGLLGLLFWTDWRLTLICLIMIPVVGIGIRIRIRIGIRVEEPERDVHAFYLVNMILTFEDLRKEALALQMFHQPGFRVLLVELERDNAVRSEFPGKLSLHDNGIAAERAGRRGSRIVPDNFSAAGLAYVNGHSAGFIFLPGVV